MAIRAGNSPVTGEFPAQGPVTRIFDDLFDLYLNKRLSKQSWGWWFEMPSRPLWRHCNGFLGNDCMQKVAANLRFFVLFALKPVGQQPGRVLLSVSFDKSRYSIGFPRRQICSKVIQTSVLLQPEFPSILHAAINSNADLPSLRLPGTGHKVTNVIRNAWSRRCF